MVNVTKLQRFFYSIQSTLIVTNTFLAASVCYSHRTGVSKRSPHVHMRVWVCECVRAEMKWSTEADCGKQRLRALPLALDFTVLRVASESTEQPGNVRKLAATGAGKHSAADSLLSPLRRENTGISYCECSTGNGQSLCVRVVCFSKKCLHSLCNYFVGK